MRISQDEEEERNKTHERGRERMSKRTHKKRNARDGRRKRAMFQKFCVQAWLTIRRRSMAKNQSPECPHCGTRYNLFFVPSLLFYRKERCYGSEILYVSMNDPQKVTYDKKSVTRTPPSYQNYATIQGELGPFLSFLVLELQRGYLYQNGVEFRQKVIGAGLNLFLVIFTTSQGVNGPFPCCWSHE